MEHIVFGNRLLSHKHEPYIIAEIGANHNGNMDLAKKIINSAKKCGCDAVKFQSWTSDSLISTEEYERNLTYTDSLKRHFGSLRDMVVAYQLSVDEHKELRDHCLKVDIEFCSTPFSFQEVDLLLKLDVPFLKLLLWILTILIY